MKTIKYKNIPFKDYTELYYYIQKELGGVMQKEGNHHDEVMVIKEKLNEIIPLYNEERHTKVIEYWETLDKKFEDVIDIPGLNLRGEEHIKYCIPALIRCGAIPLNKLKINQVYLGRCRNNRYAKWDGKEFIYYRTSFNNRYTDTINHFEEDNGYDLFVPIKEVSEEFFK